ncbi:polyprenyl synthetase family protein [Kocuria marina]|uniref:Geranylgeranyl diphosphate synthase, type I n=1 Tax=Kocuria marina subsp. indica TaxID=1049583 RepID=A0A1X7C1N4_9MICC|nr:polyprenyl synthetase family protein [Kocuria indica]OXS85744.1 polyprenyl synthetase [Kocuria indica]RLP59535.1 polyprenyl synthetase family protein [Kocuria indica]SME88401.1 geranylgeranyl diphosphate synthase, type I [Kocuria indica]
MTPSDASVTATQQDRDFSALLDERITEFFARERERVTGISPHATVLVDAIEDLTRGGKRLRARLCYWGWRAAGGAVADHVAVAAAASLELFQTAALIHDDILDRSDTRRGKPSVHRVFEALHRDAGWSADAAHFGVSAAILTGDMSLSFAEQLFADATARVAGDAAATAREIFSTMRTEVMAGQYLDIHAEVAPAVGDPEEQLERAMTVLRYKSAKYSVEHPVEIGAALAGADRAFLADCSAFALPVGEAFQLRDDVLGVFGDPETTGKPAGDDIREGKRTALIALCAASSSAEDIAWLESVLGRAELTEQEVHRARDLMRDSGAHARSEDLITSLVRTADTQLARLHTDDVARAGLQALADAAVRRAK